MAGATARWLVLLLVAVSAAVAAAGKHERWRMSGRLGGRVVEKERRRVVAEAEAGTVTAVDVADAAGTVYRLHFITMDPGALFLPVQLHADMVFYVHSGRGKVTYVEEDSGESSSLEVERGDVYNLEQGSIMFIQSYPNATRQRLRIYAIFSSEGINADDPSKPMVEAYSSVSNLLKGFETEVLRLGFGVHRDVAEAIKSAKTPPPIIPYNPQEKGGDDDKSNWTEDIVDALLGVREPEEFLNKKKKDKHKKEAKDKKSKSKAFNFYSGKPDVHNCYGWSRTMTNKDLDALHGSNIGMFMVNLTTGSMVGPHWNPKATEIAIVTDGSGIVQVVCPSITSSNSSGENRRGHHRGDERGRPGGRGDDEGESEGVAKCRNTVFRVKEGDVFVVPRFHPMAQMSFNNDSFVFVGFSTHMGQNHPQFLAGKGSVLQAIGKEVLALSLGQKNSTAVGKLLSAQRDSTILSCISCAEELEEKAAEEEQRRREQEEKERKEREEKEKREREEEERKREQEEKERKEREEEERKREQEEKERKEREEEERKKEQEEKERKEREEEERKREQEERERKEEEERQRRKEEERERREQEEKQRRKEEERARREEEQRQREEEERQREEEEQRREEEEGGGGRGDEPEREEDEAGGDEPPPYRLSKKLKKRYRLGTFRSG